MSVLTYKVDRRCGATCVSSCSPTTSASGQYERAAKRLAEGHSQVLRMKVGLRAVRAGEFSISVLLGNLSLGGSGARRRRGRPSRRAGQNASPALRADDVSGLVALLHQRRLAHHRALGVWRGQAALWHHAASRHRSEDGRNATAGRWSRGDGLGVGRRDRRLGHHGGGGGIRLLVLLVGVVHHGICRAAGSLLRRGRRVRAHRVGSVWCCRRARRVRVARVHRHGRIVVERRQRLALAVLQVVTVLQVAGGRDGRR